jgi:micrococcal nuclease
VKEYVRWPLVVFVILLIVAFLLRWAGRLDVHEVIRVYDGDTIQLDDGRTIRLIGVDAPEVDSPYSKAEPFGEESRAYLQRLLSGKKVSIKVGPTPVDRYGRTLAYVYVGDVLVNGRIIKDGWARAEMRFHHRCRDLFAAYEKEARAKRIGMWEHSP